MGSIEGPCQPDMPHFHPAIWEDTAKTLRIKLVGKVRQCLWVWSGVWSQHHELVTQACSFLFCSADCFLVLSRGRREGGALWPHELDHDGIRSFDGVDKNVQKVQFSLLLWRLEGSLGICHLRV